MIKSYVRIAAAFLGLSLAGTGANLAAQGQGTTGSVSVASNTSQAINPDDVKLTGTITGWWADLKAGGKEVKRTVDLNNSRDRARYAYVRDKYVIDLKFASKTRKGLYAATTGACGKTEALLTVAVAKPQKTLRLKGTIDGNKFIDSGMCYGFQTEPVKNGG